MKLNKTFVIALGGSVIISDKINVGLLKKFKRLILKQCLRGKKFLIVVGGGKLARNYQDAAKKIALLSYEDMDWIGIHSTRLNAHLLRTIFKKEAEPVILDSEEKPIKFKKPIIIASGWRPGWSTDYVSVRLAKKIGADFTIIAGKPAYLYTKDNQKHKDAKPIKFISFKEYQKLIPNRWIPGLSLPLDPIGAKFAKKWGIKIYIIGGTNLKNLNNLLNGKKFIGTTIQ